MLTSVLPTFATDETVDEKNIITNEEYEDENDLDFGLKEDDYIPLTVYEELPENIEYATKYDPRSSNILTSVKSQSPYGLCWMFASNSLLEQFVSKNYGTKFDLSELHGAMTISSSIVENDDIRGYYYRHFDSAGNFSESAQYLTNWNSPIYMNIKWNSIISEENYPNTLGYYYTDKGNQVYTNMSIDEKFSSSESLFNVTDAKYILNDSETIKHYVLNSGAVYCTFRYDQNYATYDENFDKAYCMKKISNKTANHAVTIVGWDDNYPKENFSSNCQPKNDGAWLVKDSNGTILSTGYIWISYEDEYILSGKEYAAVTGVQKNNDDEYMLSKDFLHLYSTDKYIDNNTVTLMNVFDISDYIDEYDYINKVMCYLKVYDCSYNIKITQLVNDELPSDLTDLSVLATGTYSGEGYLTAKLNSNYYFTSEEKCAVIVEIQPNATSSYIYIPTESDENSYLVNTNESFYSIGDGDWNDITDKNIYNHSGNLCIRPVLKKECTNTHYATITPNVIEDTTNDVTLTVDADSNLFNIHTKNNVILRQDRDYIRNGNEITLKSSYLETLGENYTELVFEFNNDVTNTVVINPKATISSVTINGSPIVDDTLTAEIDADILKENYDVTYQWQVSRNGNVWSNISGATSKEYTVEDNYFQRYLRVKVTSKSKYGNVVYPLTVYSKSTTCKVVILGDVDIDGEMTIQDVTELSKYLASMVTFDNEQLLAADVNRDGNIDISDLTEIQLILAKMK
jgi:C1A family cysteine protease